MFSINRDPNFPFVNLSDLAPLWQVSVLPYLSSLIYKFLN